MDRIEQLRNLIDDIVRKNPDIDESRCGFVHLYGVSEICTLLALKRGLNVEQCLAAGMLHDIWNYQFEDSPEHGKLGAIEAEKILTQLGSFSFEEIGVICTAISRHSDKQSIDGEMDELLKDADVFQHFLYEPSVFYESLRGHATAKPGAGEMRIMRLERILAELGIQLNQLQEGV